MVHEGQPRSLSSLSFLIQEFGTKARRMSLDSLPRTAPAAFKANSCFCCKKMEAWLSLLEKDFWWWRSGGGERFKLKKKKNILGTLKYLAFLNCRTKKSTHVLLYYLSLIFSSIIYRILWSLIEFSYLLLCFLYEYYLNFLSYIFFHILTQSNKFILNSVFFISTFNFKYTNVIDSAWLFFGSCSLS